MNSLFTVFNYSLMPQGPRTGHLSPQIRSNCKFNVIFSEEEAQLVLFRAYGGIAFPSGLSVLTMGYTSLYIVQHYVLYRDHDDDYLTKDDTSVSTSILGDQSGTRPRSSDRTPLLGP